MNYDEMSVHDPLCEASDPDAYLDEIEVAIRKAVIREASVGEIVIEQHEGYMSPDPMFTVGAESKLKAGTFYIVPKEGGQSDAKSYRERLRDAVSDEINGEDIDPTPD